MPETLDPPPVTELQESATEPQRLQRYRNTPTDPKLRELAKALYLQGKGYPEIEAATGVQQPTIRSWVKRNNWKELVTRLQNITPQIIGVRSVSVATTAQNANSARLRAILARELEQQATALAQIPPKASDLPNTPQKQGRSAVLKCLTDTASVIHDWESTRSPGLVLIGEVESADPDDQPIELAQVSVEPELLPDTTTESVPPKSVDLT